MHHEIISYLTTAAGAGGAAAAAVTSDSLTVRNAIPGTKAEIIQCWGRNQVAGFQGLTAPSWNDTTRGIQYTCGINTPLPQLNYPSLQPVQAQEPISATIGGSAVGGDIEQGSILLWYDNVPGISGRYLDRAGMAKLAIRAVTVRLSITTTATGAYTGSVALNSATDLLRPNTDYALVGASIGVACCSVGIRSPDWSNVRVGIPGMALRPDITGDWFALLSDRVARPMIPVCNYGNKANIFVDCLQDENAAAVTLSLNLIELQTTGVNTRG